MFSIFNTNVYSQSLEETIDDIGEANLKYNKQLPILNNFRSIPSDLVDNPFITSYLKTSVGAEFSLWLNLNFDKIRI
jgi:hypothetical protein